MPKIVVSYRRADSAAIAGRIFDRLAQHYGDDSVFMDVDNIPFGTDFRHHIRGVLETSDIFVAVIGPNWTGSEGKQRIKEAADPVRVEVETALQRGLPIIPILVDGAHMPAVDDLPEPLQDFAFINAAQVDTGRDFRQHMERVLRSMDGILAGRGGRKVAATIGPSRGGTSKPLWLGGSLLAIVALAAAGWAFLPRAWLQPASPPEKIASTTAAPASPAPVSPAPVSPSPISPAPSPPPPASLTPTSPAPASPAAVPSTPISPAPPAAPTDDSFPVFSGRVSDQTTLLAPATIAALTEKLADLESRTNVQVVVALLRNTPKTESRTWGRELFRNWNVGGDEERGVLFIFYPNTRNFTLHVGRAVNDTLNKSIATSIVGNVERRIRAKDLVGAVLQGVDDIAAGLTTGRVATASADPAPVASPSPPPMTYRVPANVSDGLQNMRSGPATKYPVVVAIPAGSTGITIGGCRKAEDGTRPWCAANWRNYSGWISSCCIVNERNGAPPPTE